MKPILPVVSPARAERIAAACAKLVDLLARQPVLQPVPVVSGARETVTCPRCGHTWQTVKYPVAYCRMCGCATKVKRQVAESTAL